MNLFWQDFSVSCFHCNSTHKIGLHTTCDETCDASSCGGPFRFVMSHSLGWNNLFLAPITKIRWKSLQLEWACTVGLSQISETSGFSLRIAFPPKPLSSETDALGEQEHCYVTSLPLKKTLGTIRAHRGSGFIVLPPSITGQDVTLPPARRRKWDNPMTWSFGTSFYTNTKHGTCVKAVLYFAELNTKVRPVQSQIT